MRSQARRASAESERLNRAEFALLDQMLAARREAGLTHAQVAERMGTKAPAITRLARVTQLQRGLLPQFRTGHKKQAQEPNK